VFVIIPYTGKVAGFCFGFPAAALLCLIFSDFWLEVFLVLCDAKTANHGFLWISLWHPGTPRKAISPFNECTM
jgi:hypothetical protein